MLPGRLMHTHSSLIHRQMPLLRHRSCRPRLHGGLQRGRQRCSPFHRQPQPPSGHGTTPTAWPSGDHTHGPPAHTAGAGRIMPQGQGGLAFRSLGLPAMHVTPRCWLLLESCTEASLSLPLCPRAASPPAAHSVLFIAATLLAQPAVPPLHLLQRVFPLLRQLLVALLQQSWAGRRGLAMATSCTKRRPGSAASTNETGHWGNPKKNLCRNGRGPWKGQTCT